jgi:chromosome segregation ATPase
VVLLVLNTNVVPLISVIVAAMAALSTILLGYLRWGREDVGKAADTAKVLIETMQSVNNEIEDSMVRLADERNTLRAEVVRLEKRLDVANKRAEKLENELARMERLLGHRSSGEDDDVRFALAAANRRAAELERMIAQLEAEREQTGGTS